MPDIVRETALKYLRAGYSVIPTGENKRPLGLWKEYQHARMDEKAVPARFTKGARIAIICGIVSGNLEVIDFDDPETFAPFLEFLSLRASSLADKLRCHRTPSGGYHILYRSEVPPKGNQVFARSLDGKVRIETRGEGGYFLVPPSQGYSYFSGPDDCAVLMAEEVTILHETAKTFEQKDIPVSPGEKRTTGGDAPGKRFNAETDPRELLLKYGWKPDGKTTAGEGWTRPGKDSGVSGVLLSSTGNFYCWTSNASPLEPQKSYTPFALYAHYEYSGNYSAAAKSLKSRSSKESKPSNSDSAHETPVDKVKSVTIATIMRTQYKKIRWAVPGIIPEGMTVLAGRPKFGKSWLMLGLAYAVATGSKAWGFVDVEKASVHYLALEDSERRIQDRIWQMEGYFDEYPENLHIYTDFPRIGDEFAVELTRILDRDPATGLIIIDTLQKVRPVTGGKRGNANLYQVEYEDYEKIQKWSISAGIPVICVHHTRKGDPSKSGNPFDEVSGSTGIQGVADTLIVCDRAKGSNDGIMYVTGREVCEENYPMYFETGTMTWELKASETEMDSGPFMLSTWFMDHEFITVKEAAKLWGINQRTAMRKLDALVESQELIKNKDISKKNLATYYPENLFFGKKPSI